MKKILSILLFTAIALPVFAQTTSFGLKVGKNFSTLSNDKTASGTSSGLNVGAIMNVQFEEFAIQPGLFYSVKGVKQKLVLTDPFTALPYVVNKEVKINYIEVPVVFLHKFPTKSSVRFFAGGGMYLASARSGTVERDDQAKKDISFDDYYSFDFGFTGTAGVELKKRVIIGASYDLGVGSVVQVQKQSSVTNKTFGIVVGYLF